MSEVDEMRLMMVALSNEGARVFRNNVALGVVGDPKVWIRSPQRVTVGPGDCVVRNARVLHAGLHEGSHDLIGWDSVVVTPEMVGRRIAVLTSIEAKGRRGLTPEQATWMKVVAAAGGITGVAHTAAEAVEIVRAYRRGAATSK